MVRAGDSGNISSGKKLLEKAVIRYQYLGYLLSRIAERHGLEIKYEEVYYRPLGEESAWIPLRN